MTTAPAPNPAMAAVTAVAMNLGVLLAKGKQKRGFSTLAVNPK